MTIFLNHLQQTRAVVPLYVADASDQPHLVENIPDVEVRMSANIDIALSHNNPHASEVWGAAKALQALVDRAEAAEEGLDASPVYTTKQVVLSSAKES